MTDLLSGTGTGTPAQGGSGPAPDTGAGTIAPPPSVGAPELSAAELASARDAWVSLGYDPAAFDQAARLDGHDASVAVAQAEDLAQHFANHGLPQNPTAADFHPVWADPHIINEATNNAMREFAASIGFSPETGKAVLEHLSELGAQWRTMNETQRQLWQQEQRVISTRQLGGEEAFKEAHDRAAAILRELGGKVGSFLAGHAVLVSPYLLTALSVHSRMVQAFAASYPEK
jgi:hypothetical protein